MHWLCVASGIRNSKGGGKMFAMCSKKMIENILHKWIQMAQHVKAHSKCMLYIFYKSFSLKRKFLTRVYVMHIN